MTNVDGQAFRDISSDKYCVPEGTNVEFFLKNRGLRFLPKCVTPIRYGFTT